MDSLHLFLLYPYLPTSPGYSTLSLTDKPRKPEENPPAHPVGKTVPFPQGCNVAQFMFLHAAPEVVQYNCPPLVSPMLLVLQA